MAIPEDYPTTINVKTLVARLEDEHRRRFPPWCRRRNRPSPYYDFPQMPLLVMCNEKMFYINFVKPKDGEKRKHMVGGVKTGQAKEALTMKVIKHFNKHYEAKSTPLEGFQDLCVHLGFKKGETVEECKEVLEESGERGIFINIYDFEEAFFKKKKAYRYPAIEPLRYYSYITDRVYPLPVAKRKVLEGPGAPRQLKQKRGPKTPNSLKFMLVNMAGNYKGEAYDKGNTGMKKRVKMLEDSYTTIDGRTPAESTGRDNGSDTNEVSDSDDDSEPKTPGDENMGEMTNRFKTLGIPNGV